MGRDRVSDLCFCRTGEMMKNRWGYDIRRGMEVIAHKPRGGIEIDKIAKVEKTGAMARAYGPRVILQSGASYGIDDVSPAIATTMQPQLRKNPSRRYSSSQFLRDLKNPYAWPGGYPRYFVTSDGEALSFKDAAENKREIVSAIRSNDNSGWRVVGVDINYEDTELYSAHSGDKIESAYGDNEPRKNPSRRVKSHLLHDISESASGIARDVKLLKNPHVCNTCGKPPSAPYRVYDARGKVVQGCVDDFHTGHLVTPSESARWHNSPAAKKVRAAYKRGMKYGFTKAAAMRKNPSRRVTRAVAGKCRVEWSTNGKEWHAVQGLKNLNRATAHAAAKQIHKGAPSRWVRVVP